MHELNIEADKERSARIKLEQQVAPRAIAADAKTRLIARLGQAKGSVAKIRATNSTAESAQFAEQLRDVFLASGWRADPVFYNMVAGTAVEPGIVMVVQNDKSALGVLVQQAFRSIGMDINGAIDPDAPQDTVSLIVGQRPAN